MKLTFAPKSLAARSFRCVTFGGPVVLGPYRYDEAEPACTGAVAGQDFSAGAAIGQDYHSGAEAGQV
ncbi:MAG: hypothetical protein K8R46_11100 [Pirellulales bacterium]|nr:hypothetical protein [Pirellulales bacterium]